MNVKERFKLYLIEQAQQFATPYDQYRWADEKSRWLELVFCILFRSNSNVLDAAEMRKLVFALGDLGCLEVEVMAPLCKANGEVDTNLPEANIIIHALTKVGVPMAQAQDSVLALSEAACSVKNKFDGKIQKYLRHYGQKMMHVLETYFTFSKLDNDDLSFIFRHWLQNVLYLPIQLSFKDYVEFEEFKELTLGEMIDVADELDINLALVDDILNFAKGNSA